MTTTKKKINNDKVLPRPQIDVNLVRTTTGSTPLFIASENGYVVVKELLSQSQVNINQGKTEDGTTPFIVASLLVHCPKVKLRIKDTLGKTEIDYAKAGRALQILKMQ